MKHLRLVPSFMTVLALLAAGSAQAQYTGYDLERLSLDPSARGSLVLGSGETLPAGGARLSVAGGYERSPLALREAGLRGRGLFSSGHRFGDVVKDRWTLHLVGAAAITERLELGVRLPLTLSQKGEDLSAQGLPSLRSTGEGPISGMLRYAVTRQDLGRSFSSAVALEAALPIHHTNDLDGDPSPSFSPRVEAGRRFERFLVAANLGAVIRPDALDLPGNEKLRHEVTGGVVLATVGRPLRYEVSLRGAANGNGLGPHGELLGGARLGFRYAEVFALAGPGLFGAPGTPTFRALLGVALFTPEPSAAAPAPVAAPPPPADPCAPGQAHTPDQCPALDDDGDGVSNGQDRCPTVPGIAELQGCPAVDSDGDGVPDHLDKCPTVKGLAEYQGCPPPDRDGDGITDAEDKCPDQPGIAELQGCPPQRAEIKGGKIDIHEKVYFETGKAVVQPRSFALLDDVAKLVAANPQVGKIRVEGHTDDRGPAEVNRRLSLARAEAVRTYLSTHGVAPERLEAQGFGPDQPAASNKTAAGREVNRRVEFSILGVEKP